MRYQKSAKHDPATTARGRQGSKCPARKSDEWAQSLLDASIAESATVGAKRYAFDPEHGWFCAKPHRLEIDLWHGWPVATPQVPFAIRRRARQR